MTSLKPKDIFQKMVDYLFSYMEPYGFRLTKSNEIKKKNKLFSTRIFFFRDYKNYIVPDGSWGTVNTEIYCFINIKGKEGVYRLDFADVAYHRFQLYDKNARDLNYTLVDEIWKIIKENYVNVIVGLETKPHSQLLAMPLVPETTSKDSNLFYTCSLKRELLEIFDFQDVLDKYDKNSEFYYRPQEQAKRRQDSYFLTNGSRINREFCERLDETYLFELLDRAYIFLKTTEIHTARLDEEYRICRKNQFAEKERFVLSVFMILYCDVYIPFKKEESVSQLTQEISELHIKLFKE